MNLPFTQQADSIVRNIKALDTLAIHQLERGDEFQAFQTALAAYRDFLKHPTLHGHPEMPLAFQKIVDLDNIMTRESFAEVVRHRLQQTSASAVGWPAAIAHHQRKILMLWSSGVSLFELGCMLIDGPERRDFYRAARVKQNTWTFREGDWVLVRVKYRMKGGWVFTCEGGGRKQDLAEGFLDSFAM